MRTVRSIDGSSCLSADRVIQLIEFLEENYRFVESRLSIRTYFTIRLLLKICTIMNCIYAIVMIMRS